MWLAEIAGRVGLRIHGGFLGGRFVSGGFLSQFGGRRKLPGG